MDGWRAVQGCRITRMIAHPPWVTLPPIKAHPGVYFLDFFFDRHFIAGGALF